MIRTRNHIRVVDSQIVAGAPAATRDAMAAVGLQSVYAAASSRVGRQERADYWGEPQGLNSFSASQMGASPVFYDTLLTGFAGDTDEANQRFYRDIYWYDTTAGSAVDLIAAMPFGEFTLSGVSAERLQVYNSATAQLNIGALFPELTVDVLANGYSVCSLIYDRNLTQFTDCISHEPTNVTRQSVPMRSADPLITVKRSQAIEQFVSNNSQAAQKLRKKLGMDIIRVLSGGNVELEPLLTLYVARRTFSYDQLGTSIFKRILPIYFLEKALYKGTMTEAARRQRAMLHLECGNDTWEPTNDELAAVVSLMQQADLDPLGAIVATRQGVTPSEVRQGGDFWKFTDLSDVTGAMKLRALGISEAFLSGDASFANADAAISVFIQGLRAHRNRMTQAALINKIFPLVAASKGFLSGKHDKEHAFVANSTRTLLQQLNDTSKWDIPEVQWHRPLGRDLDRDTFDLLKELRDLGVPITMRMLAASAGVSLDGLEDDLRREQKMKAAWKQIQGESGDGADAADDESNMGEFSSAQQLTSHRRSFLGRKHEQQEVVGTTRTGKLKYIHNQRMANEKADIAIAAAAARLHSDPKYANEVAKRAMAAGIKPLRL